MGKPELVSFLDFKFDPSSGDLLRGGKRLRIPKQTSRLLWIFLERPGAVVTRAELQELLWPEGEFLGHEHAINRVINDLRATLRDRPKNPKYIETVHKRGYRFLPQITAVPSAIPVLDDALKAETNTLSVIAASSLEIQQVDSALPLPHPALDDMVPEIQSRTVAFSPSIQRSKRRQRQFRWLLAGGATLLVLVALAVQLAWHRHQTRTYKANIVSLGIAPFQSEGEGAAEMGESLRLDLADALAQLPVVQIRATNSLNNIRRDDNSLRTISENLHLDMILLGKFRVQDNRNTVQFELIRGRDSLHLASFQYEGGKDELAGIRDKLQRDIFLSLQGNGKSMQSVRGSTEDAQAYGEYLQGRELTRIRDQGALNQALGHYQAAILRDPKFAQAYAGMATTHLALRYFSAGVEHQNAAKKLAQQALYLDPQLAEAHAVLGDVAFRGAWDFALSENEFRRAIELDPHKSTYHAWLASLLVDEGRSDEALSEIDRAIADDLRWPLVYSMATYVAGMAHDNDRAIAFAQKYLALVPDSPESHDQLAWAYFCAKHYDEAIAEWGRMAEMDKDPARIALEKRGREAYHRVGIQAYALVRLDAIERRSPETSRHGNDFDPSDWYAFTGQRDKAIESLRRLVADHDGEAVLIAANPLFDGLHDDPRFQALVHQVGLTLPSPRAESRVR